MPRNRSAAIRRIDPGWHGIEQIEAKEYLGQSVAVRGFYAKHLTSAPRLEVELGSGSGTFLLAAAKLHPETLFLGIEYAAKFIRLIRDRVKRAGLKNVLLLHTDGREFIRGLPDESIAALHLYFPDPWPKRSQTRRRTLTPKGLEEFARVLRPGGALYFATDHEDYAMSVAELLKQNSSLRVEAEIPTTSAAYGLETHFGQKYRRAGRKIFAYAAKKVSN